VPHIKIGDLIGSGYKMNDSFGEEMRKKVEELKD
jgi:hypothetical protein